MATSPHIIVIVVDRLGCGWLGPYGNTWVETPALNRLATESALHEFAISDSHDLAAVYRSYLSGIPAWRMAEATESTLPQLARAAGYDTHFITDASDVAHHPLVEAFEQVDLLTWTKPPRTAAESNKTRLAEVFSAASESLGASGKPKFLWIHAAAMNAVWDAPRELRERVAAEDDPAPLDLVTPPSFTLAKNYDPDEQFGIVQAYAAEVMSLDANLATLLAAIDTACDPANSLLIFTSPRGYALGEHLGVGPAGDALRGEVLHVPLLVRSPGGARRLTRLAGLRQPSDVYSLVSQAFQTDPKVSLESLMHDVVAASAKDELALRTSHWFYRRSGAGEERRAELYAKPDDRWEVNEVSQRASDVVEAFGELADWIEANCALPDSPGLPGLPDAIAGARR